MQKDNSKWVNEFEETIFDDNSFHFEEKAIGLFHYQIKHNKIYRNYCELINCDFEGTKTIDQIPFLPISFYKTQNVTSGDFKPEVTFESSGTSGMTNSKHHVKEITLYNKSSFLAFERNYGAIKDYCIIGLLPSYLERKGSSLVHMVNEFIKVSKHPKSGFFLQNTSELHQLLTELSKNQQKTLLIGVSFGLLDFAERHKIPHNKNLIVMETGGMKGRRKELIREELHSILQNGFNVSQIHSEYGMTELLSQAYSKSEGKFQSPPWMKVLIRKQDDPFSYCKSGESGAINIIDLANIHSCGFIQTDDLGRKHSDSSFEVLGRFDVADVRGCNLMVN